MPRTGEDMPRHQSKSNRAVPVFTGTAPAAKKQADKTRRTMI